LPIYEFVCRDCRSLTEFLVRNPEDRMEMRCSSCGSGDLERVISRVHSSIPVGNGGGSASGYSPLEQRQCPSGTCSTITLPGHSRQGG